MFETYTAELLQKGLRIDERGLLDFRKMDLKTNVIQKAEGSAYVRFGETQIIAGVKLNIGTPFPDSPGEGVLMVGAEFTPLASPEFEAGPPTPDAIELARVVDRGIRESHCIELEKLKINEEKVWAVFIDIHIINHGGNLLDASALAAIAALRTTKIPKLDLENMQVLRNEYESDLPVVHTPINITVCKVGDKFLLDPNKSEESVVDSRLSISVREDEKICSLQKQGIKGIKIKDIEEMIDLAVKKSKELRKLVK